MSFGLLSGQYPDDTTSRRIHGRQPEPELVTVDAATTAVIRRVVPVAELPEFYDRSFSALAETLGAQQIAIEGPAFGLYNDVPGETVDLEVGFVTERAVRADGDVVASSIPGGRVARVVHSGAFDGLGASWGRLEAWIREQGLTAGTPLWEAYLTEPSPEMDPRDLRTELSWPVTG